MCNRKMLAFFIALFILLIGNCGKDTPVEPEEISFFDERQKIAENTLSKYKELLEVYSPGDARTHLIQELKNTENIQDAGLSSDEATVWYIAHGVPYAFSTNTISDLSNPINKSDAKIRLNRLNINYDISELPHNRKALALSPYEYEMMVPGYDETDDVVSLLENVQYQCSFLFNQSKDRQTIDLEDFKIFKNYGVILIRSHGGLFKDEVCINTGVESTKELDREYGVEGYQYPEISKSLVLCYDTHHPKPRYAIRPGWMEEYYPKKLDRTLFYAGSCYSLYNKTMVTTIIEESNGSMYFGWDEKIGPCGSILNLMDLFQRLTVDSMTCGEAYQQVLKDGKGKFNYGDSLSGQWTTHFLKEGNDELRLVEADTIEPGLCDNFPPPLGEVWTYRVIGTSYEFSLITEPFTEKINGYVVYRVRRSDNPPGLGEYIGCDTIHGEVWVASDSWEVGNPSNYTRDTFDIPIPIDFCPYGTEAGTVCENTIGVGYENRTVIEVIAYEDVTVPYRTFKNAQKVKVTYYDEGEVDEDLPPTYQWHDANIGLVKELEVEPEDEIGIELIDYQPPIGGSLSMHWQMPMTFLKMPGH